MSDLKIQGEVSLSTEKVEAALDRVGDKSVQMSNRVQGAADQAGKAVDGIGDGAGTSAEKFTRAEARMRDAIKRSTQELQLFGKTASEKVEFNIQAKGLDASKLAPYIEQLKQAEAAHKIATGSLDKMGVSAGQTAAALRNVPAQFTDIVVSLQSGQQPLTVLLQQGGQLKDMFGGIAPAARAVAGYVAGLVNPFTIAAAAAGALGFAVYKLESSDRVFSGIATSMRLTGRAAIATTQDLKELTRQLSVMPGMSKDSAEAIVAEFGKTAQIGGTIFKDLAATAASFAKVTGKDAPDAAKELAKAFADPVAGAKSLDTMLGTLSSSALITIENLTKQNDVVGAQRVLLDELKRTLAGVTEQGMTPLQAATERFRKSWDDVTHSLAQSEGLRTVNNGVVKLVDGFTWLINHSGQIADALERALPPQFRVSMAALGAMANFGSTSKRESSGKIIYTEAPQDGAANALDKEVKSALALGSAYQSTKEKIQDLRDTADVLTATIKKLSEAGKSGSLEYGKLKDQLSGVNEAIKNAGKTDANKATKDFNEVSALKARILGEQQYLDLLKSRGAAADQLNQGEKDALKYSEQLKGSLDAKTRSHVQELLALAQKSAVILKQTDAVKELNKAQEEFRKQRDKETLSITAEIDRINDKAQAVEDEIAMYGLGKEAIDSLAIARLEEKKAALLQFEGSGERVKQLEDEIDARKRLSRALDAKQLLDDNAKVAKKLSDQWKRDFDRIEDWIGDAIGRGITHGKDIFKSLIDGLKASFARLVLSPIIQPIAAFGASILNPGAAQAAGTAGSALGQTGNIFSAGKTLWDGFNTGFTNFGDTIATSVQRGMNFLNPSGAQAAMQYGPVQNSAFANGAGVVAQFAASVAIGKMVSSAISNGYQINHGNALNNIGALGGVIGSTITGLINRTFGSKLAGSGILGSISGDEFTGSSYQFKKGGFLKSDKTETSALDKATDQLFSTAFDGIYDGFTNLGKTIGAGGDLLKGFNYDFRLALADFDEEGKKKEVQRLISSVSDGAALAFVDSFRTSINTADQARSRYFTNTVDGEKDFGAGETVMKAAVKSQLDPYIDDILNIFDGYRFSLQGVEGSEGKIAEFASSLFGLGDALAENQGYLKLFGEALDFDKLYGAGKKGETVVDTFARLNTVFSASSTVAAVLGKDVNAAFGAVGLASTEARSRLIEVAGGLDALGNQTAFFAQNFLTQAEQLKPASDQVSNVFAKFGLAGDTTKDQFANIVKGLDLSTEAGAQMYAQLTAIAPAFLQIANFAEGLAKAARDLDIEYMEITGNVSGATAARRAGALADADPSLRDKMTRNWAAQDQKAIDDQGFNLALEEMRLLKNESGALAAERARELGLMDPLLHAQQKRVWALEDEKAAYDEALKVVDARMGSLQRAVQAERDAATKAYDAAMEALPAQIDNVKESITDLTSLSKSLRSTVKSMRLDADSEMSKAVARAEIQTALALAKAGGVLPDADALQDALSVVAQPNEQLYASFAEFQFAYLKDKNAISELADLTDNQLSIEEKTLKALEDQKKSTEQGYKDEIQRLDDVLTNAKDQIDALNGIDISVKSVATAMASLQGAILGAMAQRPATSAPATGGGSSGSGGTQSYIEGLYSSIAGKSASAIDAEGLAFWTGMVNSGASKATIEQTFRDAVENMAKLPKFDVGTNYVPRTMAAIIHEGEAIVPKAYNPAANPALRGASSGDTKRLEALVEGLTAEVQRLQAVVAEGNDNTRQLAEQFDNVTEGGNAIRSEVVA